MEGTREKIKGQRARTRLDLCQAQLASRSVKINYRTSSALKMDELAELLKMKWLQLDDVDS